MKVNSVALILGILFLACLMITPVMAEYNESNINGPDGWLSSNYFMGDGHHALSSGTVFQIKIHNVELTQGTKSLVHWDPQPHPIIAYAAGAPSSAYTPIGIAYGSHIIGNGTIGYQRQYDSAWPIPTEIGGYQYIQMDTWNVTGLSGDILTVITFNDTALYGTFTSNFNHPATNGTWSSTAPSGMPYFYVATIGGFGGSYTYNRDAPFRNSYNATKPSGVGITGYVVKHEKGGSFVYNSRAYITDGQYPFTALTSESVISGNDFYFNVPADSIKICVRSSTGDWYNTSEIFNHTGTATPTATPTPIAGAVYTMTTSTDYVNVSGTNTATIASVMDPGLTDLKYIGAYWSNSTNAGDQGNFYEVGSTVHSLSYTNIGGTWYGYDSADVDYNNAKGGIPNPLTLKWDTTNGDKILHVTLQNSAGDYTYLTRTIHVGQGTQTLIQTKAQAMDGTNGGSLGMVSMQIFNHNTQTWTNLSPNDGLGSIITPANTILSFYAQKAGFTNGTLLNQPARGDLTYQIPLFIGPTVGAGFVNYFVTVQDTQGYPLSGAMIAITPEGNSTKTATSSSSGSQIFNLTASKLHTYTISKSGYQTRSGSFTTGTTAGSLTVQMSPIVTPTKTIVMPTGSWTVNPSYTPSGNMTGFWTPWVNVFTQMGAASDELPLLIAAMLICFCMAAGFGMGGVLGGEVAMGFGAIFCVALGLIPIWVVLAIIILGFLFYGLKIGR